MRGAEQERVTRGKEARKSRRGCNIWGAISPLLAYCGSHQSQIFADSHTLEIQPQSDAGTPASTFHSLRISTCLCLQPM